MTPRKYKKLKDHGWVLVQLRTMSPQDLAEKVGCSHSCVRHIIERYLSNHKHEIKYKRVHKKED